MPCVKQLGLTLMGLLMLTLAGCWPTEAQKAKGAEEQRIRCLDTQCEGDVVPKRNPLTQEILKINGQWYVGPKEYYAAGWGGGGFHWPSRHPKFAGGEYPERGQKDSNVDIFFTGRQRWPRPDIEKPWEGAGWEGQFLELQREGLKIQRQQITPELEIIKFFHPDGKTYNTIFYMATQMKRIRGDGLPGIACNVVSEKCNAGEFWQDDVYAQLRFNIKHAEDWPAILQETQRILQLLKRA